VRGFAEQLLRRFPHATLVRINVRESDADDDAVRDRVIALPLGAKDALVRLLALC
jgi:hypothetical protein